MNEIKPIGTIHSPHYSIEDMPIQPKGASGVEGYVIVDEEYIDGLQDLEGFSHIFLLYSFHKATRTELLVKGRLKEDRLLGVDGLWREFCVKVRAGLQRDDLSSDFVF